MLKSDFLYPDMIKKYHYCHFVFTRKEQHFIISVIQSPFSFFPFSVSSASFVGGSSNNILTDGV